MPLPLEITKKVMTPNFLLQSRSDFTKSVMGAGGGLALVLQPRGSSHEQSIPTAVQHILKQFPEIADEKLPIRWVYRE